MLGILFGRRLRERARSVRLTGPLVPAKVVAVSRSRGSNVHDYYVVTLRFTDSNGVEREHRTGTRTNRPLVGSKHWIRYDPAHPGRRSTRFVEWRRRR